MKHLRFLVLIVALLACACSNKHKRGVEFGTDVIRASSADAQRMFDEGVQALGEGRWSDARTTFQLVQSQYPEDPIAIVAEVYAARAGLGELGVLAPAESPNVDDVSLASLAQLSESKVDERVRWAAAAYYAAGLSTIARHHEATAALAQYPSLGLSPVVLASDRPALQLLVGEGLLGAGRFADALGAFAGLWHLAEHEELREFAKSRAFEAAQRIEDGTLVDSSGAKDEFVRAVAGLALLERRAARASEEETASLQTLMRRVAPDLVTIDEAGRLEAVSTSLASRAPAKRLAVGVILPLSGRAAQTGRAALDGALVAADSYRPGQATITLVFVDSTTVEPTEAIARLRVAGVSALVGPLDHERAQQWARAANVAEIPLFALTTEPLGADAGNWAFRWFIDAQSEARGVARAAIEDQGDMRIAILRPNIGYGRQSAEWFRAAAQAAGASIVVDEEYDRTASDYSRLASKVAKVKPDAIYIPDTATKVSEVTAFLAQANVWGIDGLRRPDPRNRRVQVHYLGTSLWNDAALLRQARSYVSGALIPAWSSSVFEDGPSQRFFARYQASIGRTPTDVAAFAADSVAFVRTGFQTGAADPLAIRDAALGKSLYRGITGPARFRAGGEAVRVLRFVTVADGKFVASPRTINVGLDDES